MIAQRTPLRQRRELNEIIQTALNLYGQNFSLFFRIAAVVIPLGIASGIFQTIANQTAAVTIVGVIAVGQLAVNLLSSAAIIAALDDIGAGRVPDFSRAYDVAFSRFWSLVGGVLRVLFHVLLFMITIVGIPWAIQRFVRWLFVEQVIILEGATAKEALSRSADVVIGSWWRTFGIWLLVSILAGLLVGIVAAVVALAPVAIASTVNAVMDALALPFVVIATTLLYFDLQARKEPHDLVSPA
jgi:hypothetical protein